jgi:DNA polymerase
MSNADLARMAKQYATSLRSAGIDWIPGKSEPPVSNIAIDDVPPPTAQPIETKTRSPAPPPRSSEALSTQEKRSQLQLIDQKEVRACTKCMDLVRNRTQTVFGVGNIDAELVFVGEAPGADEDRQGEPFVGAAGQLLNKIIAACKMKREEVYICNVLKCRPPGNRPPQPDEISHCRGFLQRQIALIRPRFICCLGTYAAQTLLNSTATIGRLRKQIHDYQGIKLVATYHPSYLLRNPNAKGDVWEDMKMLMREMGRPVD